MPRVKRQRVKKVSGGLTPEQATVINAVVAGAQRLYEKHADEIDRILAESEGDKISFTFAVELDNSESEPQVTIGIRFSEVHTDRVTTALPDPGQNEFNFVTPAEAKAAAAQARIDAAKEPEKAGAEDGDGEGEE